MATIISTTVPPTLIIGDRAAHQALLLDGKVEEVVHSFNFPFPLHDKIWLSSDRRHAYLSSPAGWIIKLDMAERIVRLQLRVGQQTTGIALSEDNRYLMVANSIPTTLVALNAEDFTVIRTLEVKDKDGKVSAIAAIHSAASRKSFVAVMRDIPELWEMSYDEHAEPIYEGFVHDYKMGEGIALRGPFPPRKTLLDQPLGHFLFDANSTHAIGAGENGLLQVINLNIRRKIREFHLDSSTLPDAGAVLQRESHSVLLLPSANEKKLYAIDMQTWQQQAPIALPENQLTLLLHPGSDRIWLNHLSHDQADSHAAKATLNTYFLDKKTLKIQTQEALSGHRYSALAWTIDGAHMILRAEDEEKKQLIIFDTNAQQIIRYLPLP